MFKIDRDVVKSVDPRTIIETADEMRMAGIEAHPFKAYAIEMDATISDVLSKIEQIKDYCDKVVVKFEKGDKGLTLNDISVCVIVYEDNEGEYRANLFFKKNEKYLAATNQLGEFSQTLSNLMMHYLTDVLFVMLATKNTERKTVVNDPRSRTKRVRDDAKRYTTTTTIKIGKITETERGGSGTGGPVRPHLRRGHLRNQRVGSGRSEVKRIFIQPCFVNADREWIEMAKNYKVKM